MARTDRIGRHCTTVHTDGDGFLTVTYHHTPVLKWQPARRQLILRSGGWATVTTKRRINQAFRQFGLPYTLYQTDFTWYVENLNTGEKQEFEDGMTIEMAAATC